MNNGQMNPHGELQAVLRRKEPVPDTGYKVRNALRTAWMKGFFQHQIAKAAGRGLGIISFRPTLSATVIRVPDHDRPMLNKMTDYLRELQDGGFRNTGLMEEIGRILAGRERIDLGILSYRVVTDNGVAFLVDDWDDSTTDITNMNYHASGTGAVAENQTDSALGAEATTVTDRATGTKSQPSANQIRSVGTQNFTGTAAITEHGLFSVVTESSGVLWDRSVFSAINVGNGDSIQWTYTCTISAGS